MFLHSYQQIFSLIVKRSALCKFKIIFRNDIVLFALLGSFLGDIALPGANYDSEYDLKRSKSTQQELEKLKKEVYLEGLQVEEEGLTDVLRKKIKQAITIEDKESKRTDDKILNEALVRSNKLCSHF